jgi:hypothetical protein
MTEITQMPTIAALYAGLLGSIPRGVAAGRVRSGPKEVPLGDTRNPKLVVY